MQQSPREANRFSASQEIPRILWNPMVHYGIHKCPSPVPILSHVYSVHTPSTTSWRLILILSSHLRLALPNGLFLRFPHQNPVYASPLPHTRYMSRPSHSSRFYHTKNNGWAVHIIKLLIVYFSPLPCYLVPFTTNILNTLFSNNLSLRSFLNVNDQVSHSYKTTCRYSYIYTLYK